MQFGVFVDRTIDDLQQAALFQGFDVVVEVGVAGVNLTHEINFD
jgi:hypothetical protein